MKRVLILLPVLAAVIAGSIALFALSQTQAVQAPRIMIDMDPTGNTYTPSVDTDFDGIPESGNIMTVGTIDNCLTSIPGDNAEHSHRVQLVIQDVEDLVGWQARINFDGTKAAPANPDFDPFTDTGLGLDISFVNLPADTTVGGHHSLFPAFDIQNPTAANGTANFSAAALSANQTFAVQPDVPEKSPHDESPRTYTVTGGGVLAEFDFVTRAGQDGQQTLLLDLDDDNPVTPGSKAEFFNGTGVQSIPLSGASLGDGHHGEGVQCVALAQETPTPTPSPGAVTGTPTPGPGGPGGTPTRTPVRTATRTPAASPAALPPTGSDGGIGSSGFEYIVLIVMGVAIPASAAGIGVLRARRR